MCFYVFIIIVLNKKKKKMTNALLLRELDRGNNRVLVVTAG